MIYFIQCDHGGPIKIGYAKSVEERFKDLQAMNPYQLLVLGTLEGDLQLELRLHKKFDQYRLHHEWFEDSPEIRDFIDRMPGFDYKMILAETKPNPKGKKNTFDYHKVIDRLTDTSIIEDWSDERLRETVFHTLTAELVAAGRSEWSAKSRANRYALYAASHRKSEKRRWEAMKHQVKLFPIDSTQDTDESPTTAKNTGYNL